MAFGFPALATPGAGTLGIAVSGEALSAAIADIFAALKGPFKFSAWGIALYGILPSEIAKDDPNMMSKIVTSLPAETVTNVQVSTLPLDQATVSVTKRVTDVVKDTRQHIAVVAGVPMSVPVVNAKPTRTRCISRIISWCPFSDSQHCQRPSGVNNPSPWYYGG